MPATAASHCRLTYYRPPWPQTRAPRLATLRCRDGLWVGSNAMQVAGAAPRRAAAYKPAKTQIVTYPRPERQRSILETAAAHAKQSHTVSRTVYGHYPSQYRRLSRRVGVQRLICHQSASGGLSFLVRRAASGCEHLRHGGCCLGRRVGRFDRRYNSDSLRTSSVPRKVNFHHTPRKNSSCAPLR